MNLLNKIKKINNIKSALNIAILLSILVNLAIPHIAYGQKVIVGAKNSEITLRQLPGVKRVAKNRKQQPVKNENKPDKVIRAVITAYTSTKDQTDGNPFIGASGKRVYDGMIAVNGLPFGTKIKIPSLYGDKMFTVEDRMHKRYGPNRMDIWLGTSRAEAIKFGVKRVQVEIYYPTKKLTFVK